MMTSRSMIFHIPMQLDRQHASASQIRPLKMMAAFQSIGYHVDIVEGTAKMRQAQIRDIKKKVQDGVKYDFVYSESSTMPTLLTERHHLPTHPFLDFGFFRFCKKNKIPMGLFYRDIYWCFINRSRDWKQRVARLFYNYDLKQYEKYIDVLFLPTLDMFPHIPFDFSRKVVGLPSGCEINFIQNHINHDVLELLYVGGVGGDYNLSPIMSAIAQKEQFHLTVCCRTDDWEKVRESYQCYLSAPNISIVHMQGEALKELYAKADLFVMLYKPTNYLSFAAPFKLFEAIGYGKPLIAYQANWSGKFVESQGIGIACTENISNIISCLQNIYDNRLLLQQYINRLHEIAPLNTWESRARTVADELTKLKDA